MNQNTISKIEALIEEAKSNWTGPLGAGLGLAGAVGGHFLDANIVDDINNQISHNNMNGETHVQSHRNMDTDNQAEVKAYNDKVDTFNNISDRLNSDINRFENKIPSGLIGGVGGLAAGTGVGMAIDTFRNRNKK